jgi:hypothetical protein
MQKRWHWFLFVSYGILFIFLGVMTYVTYVCFSRKSGSTGLDMAKVQQIRYEFSKHKNNQPAP